MIDQIRRPILCLDFDGVIHSYQSGWKGPTVIPDPPVAGAIEFINNATDHFEVHIFSSRSCEPGGIAAMQKWLAHHWREYHQDPPVDFDSLVKTLIKWPTEKPPAMVTIDDRAIQFTGIWPVMEDLINFRPWNTL